VYVEQIQSLRDINNLAAQQLAADIGSVFSFLEELNEPCIGRGGVNGI